MNKLDQFYTEPSRAKICMNYLRTTLSSSLWIGNHIFIEPSAGEGAFYNALPPTRRLGLDLEPKAAGVQKKNFFHFKYVGNQRVIVIGNPPFGKNASLAVKFFNHAAWMENVDFIAFIIPKTFRKTSLQNRLSMDFHLIGDFSLPSYSFIKDGKPYDVPSCFQVWQRSPVKRKPVVVTSENKWFDFVKKSDNHDLAVRRVGWKAGVCMTNTKKCKEQSFYFLKLKPGVERYKFHEYITKLWMDELFLEVISNSAAARSLSKGEFVQVLKKNPYRPLTFYKTVLHCRHI